MPILIYIIFYGDGFLTLLILTEEGSSRAPSHWGPSASSGLRKILHAYTITFYTFKDASIALCYNYTVE